MLLWLYLIELVSVLYMQVFVCSLILKWIDKDSYYIEL